MRVNEVNKRKNESQINEKKMKETEYKYLRISDDPNPKP
jgi:hypothetical protein